MTNSVPANNAGKARVNLGRVAKAAQNPSATSRSAMTGVKGSGPVGSDSRTGSFNAAINDIKASTPPTKDGILKDTNRKLTGSGRRNRMVGEPLKLDSKGKGPNAYPYPTRTDPVETNDMHGALIKMLSRSTKPGHAEVARRYKENLGR